MSPAERRRRPRGPPSLRWLRCGPYCGRGLPSSDPGHGLCFIFSEATVSPNKQVRLCTAGEKSPILTAPPGFCFLSDATAASVPRSVPLPLLCRPCLGDCSWFFRQLPFLLDLSASREAFHRQAERMVPRQTPSNPPPPPHLPWCPAPAHGGLRAHGAPRLLATCPPREQARSLPPGPSRLCPPAWRPAFRCPLKSFRAEEPPRLCHVTLQSCSLAVCAARMPAPSLAAASLLALGWAPSKGFLFGAPETALLCTVSGQKPRATLSSCLFF